MADIDREALRARARTFVNSADFERHYLKVHVPAWTWYVFQLFRCLTLVGLPGGIRALLHPGSQAFRSGKLRERYRQLIDHGRVVEGFIIMSNSRLRGDPDACAPALVVASLAGTAEGDAIADDLTEPILFRLLLGEGSGPADAAVEAMMDDEEYQAFRKRALPTEFTGGREAWFLDVKIDNELLREKRLSDSSLYFLVDPAARGLILQIPQESPKMPPPLPVQV